MNSAGQLQWYSYTANALTYTMHGNGHVSILGSRVDRGGALNIGGTSSTARVLPQTDNVGYVGEAAFRWQAIYAVAGSINTSDEREKTEIKETTLGLDFIKDLKPVSYKWIDGEQQNKGKDEREHQGLIAQQVAETVEKHGIDKNNFGGLDIQKTEKYDDFHGMSYDQFVAPLIKAIQEQQTIIDDLKSRLDNAGL
jgi:trimeric autotransporter adhesin